MPREFIGLPILFYNMIRLQWHVCILYLLQEHRYTLIKEKDMQPCSIGLTARKIVKVYTRKIYNFAFHKVIMRMLNLVSLNDASFCISRLQLKDQDVYLFVLML